MYCPNPFHRLEIKADGSVYCCCEGWLPTPLGNVLETPLMDIWHGNVAQQVRWSIYNGDFQHCRACPYLPGPGGPVVRDRPDPLDVEIHTLKCDYDQTCNLQCQSCRINHSRNFVDTDKVARIHAAVVQSGVLRLTKRLYVTGAGDPIASPLYWSFLRNLHTLELRDGLEIFLHTNGLLLDEPHWGELHPSTQERVTEVGISVDAASEDTYRAIRGASWQRLWSNINFLNRLQAGGKKLMIGMFYTVQAANVRELIPFVRLAWRHNVSWISVTALRNWGTYTESDYLSRAVHLPSHPEHGVFQAIVSDERLTKDPRIILDRFNPEYVDQMIVCNPDALLPANQLRPSKESP